MRIAAGLASSMLALAAAGAASAQDQPTARQPPPTPQEETPAAQQPGAPVGTICTDRPTKANAPCTVPPGDFQIETDLANWSRTSMDGVTSNTVIAPNPTFKYGVSKSLDVELNWAPWEQLRVSAGGRTTTESSVGDLFLRAKWAVVSGDAFHLSLIPYVKVATAAPPDIGNGRMEGGLIAPMSFALPAKFNLVLGPELDALANADREGSHLSLTNLINLSRPVGRWTLYAELWNEQDFDPAKTVAQTTADFAATYLLNDTLQLDAGANIGLTRAAPERQLYLGVSHRF